VDAEKAKADALAIMVDGAHGLTPGVLHYSMAAFQNYPNPVVAPRCWFTGPGQRGDTVTGGYGPEAEDRLFEQIDWPIDGYRLFELGVFIGPGNSGMSRSFESEQLAFNNK
jgi:hypothetical protein